MNIALVFAGGIGKRMNNNGLPKQFLDVYGKPILVWTLEKFQNSKVIDHIILVMLESYIDLTTEIINKYNLTKVKSIVPGGKTGQESIYNGLKHVKYLQEKHVLKPDNAIIFVHDGVRPFITDDLLYACYNSVLNFGSAIAVAPAVETVIYMQDNQIKNILNRSSCYHAKAPQCFYFNELYNCHILAIKNKLLDFVDSASLMTHYGYELHTIETNADNIKITTPKDFYLMKALLKAYENLSVIGI